MPNRQLHLPRTWLAVVLLVCGSAWPLARVAAQQPPAFTVQASHGSESLAPGDITLVTVTASHPRSSVEGTALDRPIRFWPSGTPGEWHGFIGMALTTKPGAYTATIRATGPNGEQATSRLALQVRDKKFETRNLKVASQFVDPPASEAQRIARDQQQLNAVFTRTGTERLWRGAFQAPVPGRATSSFGRLSILNGKPGSRHQGADFSAAVGTPVRAPNAGRVVLASDLYFSGNTVVLDHGAGLFSLFAHLSRIAVGMDALVTTGELVGDAGATGRVTGPHLHWAVRLGEISVDPLALISVVARLDER